MIASEREELFMQALKALYAFKMLITEDLRVGIEKMESEPNPLEGPAQGMLEAYRNELWRIQVAEAALKEGIKKALKDSGAKREGLICTRCKMRIKKGNAKCGICGWSWRPLSA